MAIVLTIGDRFLFMANSNINSKASIIKLINEISIIETIILGKIFFKEKKILKKILCTLLIIIGVIIVIM